MKNNGAVKKHFSLVKEFYNKSICKWVCLLLWCLRVLDNVATFCLGKLPSLPGTILKANSSHLPSAHPENLINVLYLLYLWLLLCPCCASVWSQQCSIPCQGSGLCLEGAGAQQRLLGSLEGFCLSAQESTTTEHRPPKFPFLRCFLEAT